MLKKESTYQNAILNLPRHEADELIWDKIEQRLNNESELSRSLPQHSADPAIWSAIEERLDQTHTHGKRRRVVAWIAAAILITAFFIPFASQNIINKHVLLVISEEEMEINTVEISSELDLEDDILSYCSQNPDVCESPDFNALNTMLTQLKSEKTELIELNQQLNDPSINTYLNTVNNNIAQVQRKLLSLF